MVVAEASGFASVSSEIVARVTERCFHSLAAPIRRVTGFDIPYPPPKLEHFQLPGVDRVLDAVDDLQWDELMTPDDRTFLLPDLGEGLTEAEVVRWLVAEGDIVDVDQPVVEVETAKSLVEVPTPYAGRVATLHAAEGDRSRSASRCSTVGAAADARGRDLPRGGAGRLRQRPHRLRDVSGSDRRASAARGRRGGIRGRPAPPPGAGRARASRRWWFRRWCASSPGTAGVDLRDG